MLQKIVYRVSAVVQKGNCDRTTRSPTEGSKLSNSQGASEGTVITWYRFFILTFPDTFVCNSFPTRSLHKTPRLKKIQNEMFMLVLLQKILKASETWGENSVTVVSLDVNTHCA